MVCVTSKYISCFVSYKQCVNAAYPNYDEITVLSGSAHNTGFYNNSRNVLLMRRYVQK